MAAKVYQNSPYCSRAYLPDDPLQMSFREVKQCTSLDDETFTQFIELAHKYIYHAPMIAMNGND